MKRNMATCLLCEISVLHATFVLMQRTNESLQLGMCYGLGRPITHLFFTLAYPVKHNCIIGPRLRVPSYRILFFSI